MIPHNLPMLGAEEQSAAARVIASGWVAQGPEVEAFENDLCSFLKLPEGHAVAVSSGSAALYLALWALDGGAKRIGLPVYACAALRNAVGYVAGKGIYLDCEPGGPNVDVNAACRAGIDILIAPSIFGIPVNLQVQQPFNVVEDLAQALGADVAGQRIGLRGEVGICSFYATKLITSGGQGGAVVSHDMALIENVRDYREFDCRVDEKLRFNFKMTDIQAAIGRVQLRKLPEFLQQRERIFEIYRDEGLNLLDSISATSHPARYRAVIRCDNPARVIQALAIAGVHSIVPIEELELLNTASLYPHALHLTHTTLSVPCYPALPEKEAIRIAQRVKELL